MNILIKSGWLGRNKIEWYSGPDNIGLHIIALVEKLRDNGFTVKFSGENCREFSPHIELHFEKQWPASQFSKKILIKSEAVFVQPQNLIPSEALYDIIFDWRTEISLSSLNRHYFYPRNLELMEHRDWIQSQYIACCVASNKNAVINSRENLYPVRQKYIQLFNDKFGKQFGLFGGGWFQKDHPVGILSKVAYKKFPEAFFLKRANPYLSYQGRCGSKFEVMRNSRFALCIENVSAPGSVSEKLIDCFSARVIPIFLGATDIENIISPELFVDIRKFSSNAELFNFIETADELFFQKWQEKLESEVGNIQKKFSIEVFTDKILNAVGELYV